jgi:hypothetical protein
MVTAATVQAAAEALALVQATGLPPEKFASAMQQNASYSKTLAMKLPKMIEQNFERHFSVQHMLKDMQIASRLGLTNHLELGVTAAARDRLMEQMQRGHGDEDYSAVARKYVVEPRKPGTETELELFQRRAAEPNGEPKPQPVMHELGRPIAPAAQAAEVLPQNSGTAPAAPQTFIREKSAAVEQPAVAAVENKKESVAEERLGSQEAISPAGATLEALQTHVPAAPFLHPVESAGSAAHQNEQPADDVAVQSSPEFLSEGGEQLSEQEERQTRGFFSKLLRRANT